MFVLVASRRSYDRSRPGHVAHALAEDTMTTWTLWRGNDLLGALRQRSVAWLPRHPHYTNAPEGALVAGSAWLAEFTHDADASTA